MGEISEHISDGTHKTPTYLEQGVRFISAKDIQKGYIDFKNCKYVLQDEYIAIQNRCNVKLKSLLIAKSGSLGNVVVYKQRGFSPWKRTC
ncbi:hypothetical protein [Desulfitobacterium hafniense]|uniref:hypothetical protein n=1 Tax=Desulfitobacterium hafniense TaxID=49338 RepID=UPI00037B07DE|nr:hypothetical protein [Desulfitobacterium hafniense]